MTESVAAADRGGNQDKDHDREMTVHVKHLGEHAKENFKILPGATLQQLWDKAYDELGIARQERDVLQAPRKTGNPVDLTPHLGLSLVEAQAQELCGKDFEIAAGTGGA